MEKDELQLLSNEANQLIQESNDVLYSTKLSENTKETSLKAYRNKLLTLREKLIRIKGRRAAYQEFLATLSNNKGNAKG